MSRYHRNCTNSECDPKEKKKVPEPAPAPEIEIERPHDDVQDLLATISPNRACSCEVAARAVRDDVSKYIGLTNRRAALVQSINCESDCPNQLTLNVCSSNPDEPSPPPPSK